MTPIDEEEAETKLTETLLFYPEEIDKFPLDFQSIAESQQQDQALLPLAEQDDFELQEFHGVEMICKRHQDQWKIVLPEDLIEPTIDWYHIVLGHCGITRLETTLLNHLWFPNMRDRITRHVNECEHCKRYKFIGQGQGHVPPRNDVSIPWEEVAVDTIGPWKIPLPGNTQLIVHALTMIDTATTLSETVRVENGQSEHAAMLFTNNWLSRYPKPLRCVHDQGSEFKLRFQEMLNREGIKSVPTTVRNPQANAICERMHKTIENSLNTFLRHNPPENVTTATELIDSLIAAAQRAIRTAVHSTFKVLPGAIVFHRDMMLPIPLMADYNLLRERRQAVIDKNN
jgi:transposase InsO family protein